jgi:hypothetical protein
MEGEGFEPSKAEPADLQSAPFGRSGTPPGNWAVYFAQVKPRCQPLATPFKIEGCWISETVLGVTPNPGGTFLGAGDGSSVNKPVLLGSYCIGRK